MISLLRHRPVVPRRRTLLWLFAVPVLGAWSVVAQPAAIVEALQKLLDAEVAAHPSLPGELLHVHLPARGLDASLAAGLAAREPRRALHARHVFRIASVTKTFTAAAILRLAEEGKLRLGDPLPRHLSADLLKLLEGGGYVPDEIQVRHLLTHTSGLFDYATAPQYQAQVFGNPSRRWTRLEQVRLAMELGKPQFRAGGGYHYSDTGYVLLGAIIERRTGQSLGAAYRSLLDFARLGLDTTYLETLEPVPPAAKETAHAYFGPDDTAMFDPSFDLYGGGGLMSSVEDLARFYRALLRGQVFREPATLETMLAVPATNEDSPGGPYAMGISRRLIAGNVCWGHTGFWGTSAYHCPDVDLTIVRHYGQAQPEPSFIFNRLYDEIAKLLRVETKTPD